MERTEFGFGRTTASGPLEQINCKHIPGYLIPADLERMSKGMGFEDLKAWAMEHLLASPGATVGKIDEVTGRMSTFSIPTLVPARNAAGHCMHYENGLCKIHAIAPFGCAFFDTTQSHAEAQRRSSIGLTEIAKDFTKNGPYSEVWRMLEAAGRKGPSPKECRAKVDKAYDRLKRKGKI